VLVLRAGADRNPNPNPNPNPYPNPNPNQALIGEFEAAGRTPPQLGLVCAATGGSHIEEWLPPPSRCRYTARVTGEHFAARLAPFTRMSLKGWLWYQGELAC